MSPSFNPSRFVTIATVAILTGLLCACGQKGPLYLQAKPAPAATGAPASTPAPATK